MWLKAKKGALCPFFRLGVVLFKTKRRIMRIYFNPLIIKKKDTHEKFVPLHMNDDVIVVDKVLRILPFVFISRLEGPLSASKKIFYTGR